MANKNLFNSIKLDKPKNNVFDLTHDVKLSLNMGDLVPIMCMECIPGDRFQLSCESLLRFAPLVSPVMHRMDVTMHYFFVPNRLIWDEWEDYIVNKSPLPAFPTVYMGTNAPNVYTPLCDYLGVPRPIGAEGEQISALPFAVYQFIFNEYYRDQNLIPEVDWELEVGDNTPNADLFMLRKRAWEHDYFTSALPFAQKGSAVQIPVVQSFPDVDVKVNSDFGYPITTLEAVPTDVVVQPGAGSAGVGNLFADTSSITPANPTTINDLRRAFRLQEWLERNARGGTRYVENILAHFGVRSSDKRLQRPEYITGTKSPVVISEILNTTGTVDAPQGEMAGHGVSVTTGKYGSYFCEEHGYIMGIMSVMPKTAYQQGLEKHWLKVFDPFQYYWPSFAHIGEQAIVNRELYAFQGEDPGDNTFGYVPRYAEYKYMASRVAGDFRTSLDFWHLGRIFASPPALNEQFVSSNPTHRVFAVTDENVQKLYCHVLNKVRAVRPMPKFGSPSF